MRWISTFPMSAFFVLSIMAAVTPAHACRMVPQPGGGYKYVCESPASPIIPHYHPYSNRSYGAIAYSPGSGAFGYSDGYANQTVAESRALSECGKADCAVGTWFYNNCGAVATSDNGAWGGGHGPTALRARGDAEETCNRRGGTACAVKITHCSGV